jgi:hypothetical protein
MAWKQDPAISGVNKDLLQVQNPFSEIGAVFRLEGTVVDLEVMQTEAWSKVAESFRYKVPAVDDIKKASLYSPAKAIRLVFGWTSDVIKVDEIIKTYWSEFNAVFNSWLEHDRTYAYSNDSTRRNESNEKKTVAATETVSNNKPRPSKDEIYETIHLAWNKLARGKNRDPPTTDQIVKGRLLRDWEVCVKTVFGWTDLSAEKIKEIVEEYNKTLQADMETLYQKYGLEYGPPKDAGNGGGNSKDAPTAEKLKPSKEEINTTYLIAWNKLALQMGQKAPAKDQVLEGVKMRNWKVCIKDIFGWDGYNSREIDNIVVEYGKIVQEDFKNLYKNYGIEYGSKSSSKCPVILQAGITEWL